MWIGEPVVVVLLVPSSAVAVFSSAWYVAALFQPLNALSFATDGVHWGTGDFRFLRNAVLAATSSGALFLFFIDESGPQALMWVWWVTGLWIVVRAVLGLLRIWPGIGQSPFSQASVSLAPPASTENIDSGV
jgi:MATE family multidrug resistance protein